MIMKYRIRDRRLEPAEDGAQVWVATAPTEDEKKKIPADFSIDEHTFSSAADPEEPARLETEPGHLAPIFKLPENYSSQDHFLFKVTSVGLFLFRDRLALPEDVSMFSDKYFKQVSGIREMFLRSIYNPLFHFMEHLKVIGMIYDELEAKTTYSMENKHPINMFALDGRDVRVVRDNRHPRPEGGLSGLPVRAAAAGLDRVHTHKPLGEALTPCLNCS